VRIESSSIIDGKDIAQLLSLYMVASAGRFSGQSNASIPFRTDAKVSSRTRSQHWWWSRRSSKPWI